MDDKLKIQIVELEEDNGLDNLKKSNQGRSIKDIVDKINTEINENNENKIIFKIIENITSINIFSDTNGTFLIYFTNNFWKYILNTYNLPKQDNILICFNLRKLFLQYYELVIKKFGKKKRISNIRSESTN